MADVPSTADLVRTKTNMDGFNAAMESENPDATFPDAAGGVFKSKAAIEAVAAEQVAEVTALAAQVAIDALTATDQADIATTQANIALDAVAFETNRPDARLAATAPLPSNVYDNGAGTITMVATGVLTVDGTAVALNDDLVIPSETDQTHNGIYRCTMAGAVGVLAVLTRRATEDTGTELALACVEVTAGATQAGSRYRADQSSITLGTTAVTFSQRAGTVVAEAAARVAADAIGDKGVLTIAVTGAADVVLSAAQAAYAVLNFTGALTANQNIIAPNTGFKSVIANNTTGAFTLMVKTAAGTGLTVTQGQRRPLYGAGTNVVSPNAQVEADIIANASAVAADLSLVKGAIFSTAPVTIGQSPVTVGTGNAVPAISAVIEATSAAGKLSALSVEIATLGNGLLYLYVESGTAPNLTYVSGPHALPAVLATGIKNFSDAELPDLQLAAGQSLVLRSESGGPTLRYVTQTGHTAYFRADVPAGSQTFSTAANTIYCAAFTVDTPVVLVPDNKLSAAAQAELALVAANATAIGLLGPIVAAAQVIYGQNPVSTVASGGTLTGGVGLLGTATVNAPLSAVTVNVSALGTGATNLFILSGAAPNFTIVQKIALPAASAIGLKTWTASDFGTINLIAGQSIAIDCPTGGIVTRYQTLNGNTLYYIPGAPAVGSSAAWTALANNIFTGQFSQAVPKLALPRSNVDAAFEANLAALESASAIAKSAVRPATTYGADFGASAPSDWTLSSGWTHSSAGMLAPAGAGDLSVNAKMTQVNAFRDEARNTRFVFAPTATGTVQAVATYRSGASTYGPAMLIIDDVNHLLKWGATAGSWSAVPTTVASGALAALVANREYEVKVAKDRRVLTATMYDRLSGAVVGTVSVGSNSDGLDALSPGGYWNGSLQIFQITGQTRYKQVRVSSIVGNPRAIFAGDSITEMPGSLGVKLAERWADLAKTAMNGAAIIAGVASAKGGEDAATITAFDLPAIKPKRVFLYYGTNDGDAGLAAFSTAYNTVLTYCDANSIEMAVGILPPISGTTFSALNGFLLGMPARVRKVRFDLALTAGNDGTTIVYPIHPTPAGQTLMYQRVRLDLPEWFD